MNMNAPQLRFFQAASFGIWKCAIGHSKRFGHARMARTYSIYECPTIYTSHIYSGQSILFATTCAITLAAQRVFNDKIATGLGDANSYGYARQLRNEIVHRGLDLSATGHSDSTTLFVLCPPTVTDQSRKKTYTRPFTYTIELATHCNAAVNLAIGEALERLDLFNPAQHIVSQTDTVAAILGSSEIPDWVKAMIPLAFRQMDYPVAAEEIAESRIKQIRSLLGQQQGEITPAASA